MKINLYTVYNAYNYGAFLQSYALQETLKRLGADPCFIACGAATNPSESTYGGLRRRITLLLNSGANPRMALHYLLRNSRMKKAQKNLQTNSEPSPGALSLIGSDELWNIKNERIRFVPEFYGLALKGAAACYAISCGQSLKIWDFPADAIEGIRKINSVSVRDRTTRALYREITGSDCYEVLDPVFLYDFELPFRKKASGKHPYLLVYGKIDDQQLIQSISNYAKAMGLKIISCGIYNSWCRNNLACGPFEFPSIVKNASYVVTNTFHGIAFSIIYGRNFAACVRSAKADDLLDKFGLADRRVNTPEALAQILSTDWDKAEIKQAVSKEKKISFDYLSRLIKENT